MWWCDGPPRLRLLVAALVQVEDLEGGEVARELLRRAEVQVHLVDPAALLAGDGLADGVVLRVARRQRAQEEEAAGTGDGGERRRELPAADRPQQVVDVAAEDDVVGAGVLRVGRQRRERRRPGTRRRTRLARAAQRGACSLRAASIAAGDASRPSTRQPSSAGEVARVAAVAAADVEDRELRRGVRAQAGDGEASQLAGAVAPHALVGRVPPVPVQRGLRDVRLGPAEGPARPPAARRCSRLRQAAPRLQVLLGGPGRHLAAAARGRAPSCPSRASPGSRARTACRSSAGSCRPRSRRPARSATSPAS